MKFLGLWLIRAYQRCLSPLLPPACKYSPSCSHYTYQAMERHGFFAGVWLGSARLLRCNPWSHGGADPAPETIRWSWHGPVRTSPAPQYDFGLCHCQEHTEAPVPVTVLAQRDQPVRPDRPIVSNQPVQGGHRDHRAHRAEPLTPQRAAL